MLSHKRENQGQQVATDEAGKHVFISYVHQNAKEVDHLCEVLTEANIPYWRDKDDLEPGVDWKDAIRDAIRKDSVIFLGCFSAEVWKKDKSFIYEELTIAVEEVRLRKPGVTWLIPIRFDDTAMPDLTIGAGKTLNDYQAVDLFGPNYTKRAVRLVRAIEAAMGTPTLDPATVQASVGEATAENRPSMLRQLTEEMIRDDKREIEMTSLIAQDVARTLTALRDPGQFPEQTGAGDRDQQIATVATIAARYWPTVEPFCWSLQAAARWGQTPEALAPWASGLQALWGVVLKTPLNGGYLGELRRIPPFIAVFVVGLACVGQPNRWANLKTLLVDTMVREPMSGKMQSLVEAADPWSAFSSLDMTPQVLAQMERHGLDTGTALAKAREFNYHTPIADWLHIILRPLFAHQYLDDDTYDVAFDAAEVMLGVVSQHSANQRYAGNPDRASWLRPEGNWFGRVTHRSRRGLSRALEDLEDEFAAKQADWAPLKAGLFSGNLEAADEAIRGYRAIFDEVSRHQLFRG